MKTITVKLEPRKSPYGTCPSCEKQIVGDEFLKTCTEDEMVGPCPSCGVTLQWYVINPNIYVAA